MDTWDRIVEQTPQSFKDMLRHAAEMDSEKDRVDAMPGTSAVRARASHPDAETSQSTTSDWERAGAVVDRLWDRWPQGELLGGRERGQHIVQFVPMDLTTRTLEGVGPTYVAALLNLGTEQEDDHE